MKYNEGRLNYGMTPAALGELDCTVPPAAEMLMPLVMQKCMEGRGAIGAALTFIDTQQVSEKDAMLGHLYNHLFGQPNTFLAAALPVRAHAECDHRRRARRQRGRGGHRAWSHHRGVQLLIHVACLHQIYEHIQCLYF
jgi:hypothetical protein